MQFKLTLMTTAVGLALCGYGCGAQEGGPAMKNPDATPAADTVEQSTEGTEQTDGTMSSTADEQSSTPAPDTPGTPGFADPVSGNGSDDDDDAGTGDFEAPSGESGTTISGDAGVCEPTLFSSDESVAAYASQYEVLLYQATSTARGTADILSLEMYQNSQFGGPSVSGSYQFDGSNYSDCGLCMVVYSDCSDPIDMGSCSKTFLAESGTIHLTAMGQVGDQITASLEDVVLVEVTVDTSTWVSTSVDGGVTWCAHGYQLTAPIEDYNDSADTSGDLP